MMIQHVRKKLLPLMISSAILVTVSHAQTNHNSQLANKASSATSAISTQTILSAYNNWWTSNSQTLSFNNTDYSLIKNDGSGQGSGSVYTSEGIGMGMLTSAMIMYLYTQNDPNITQDDFNTAKSRFDAGFNYWQAAENSQAEQANKSTWGCYNDKLLVWTRDSSGNPNGTGSATDGDFYMTGAVLIAAKAYAAQGNSDQAQTLSAWLKDRANEIASRNFNDGLAWPYTGTPNPTLPGTGDSTCDKNLSSPQNVQPDKAVLPIMYLFSQDSNLGETAQATWKTLIDNDLKFIQTAESWSYSKYGNYLMSWPYTASQSNGEYQISSAGSSYDYDAGRNPENLGGYLVVNKNASDIAKQNTSQLLDSIIVDGNISQDSFYAGTSALGLYGLSTQQTLTSSQQTYYDKITALPVDNKYYNTGHWLMSALWMHMGTLLQNK